MATSHAIRGLKHEILSFLGENGALFFTAKAKFDTCQKTFKYLFKKIESPKQENVRGYGVEAEFTGSEKFKPRSEKTYNTNIV